MTATKLTTLEFCAEKLGFAAGHFTIYSETFRERLHGHTYRLVASITAALDETGIAFDYAIYNEKLIALCQQLHTYFLLPTESPYLRIEEEGDYYQAYFHEDKIPFLKKDVKLLPISNVTLEALSQWFLNNLLDADLDKYRISHLSLKIYNGPGHAGCAQWSRAV